MHLFLSATTPPKKKKSEPINQRSHKHHQFFDKIQESFGHLWLFSDKAI